MKIFETFMYVLMACAVVAMVVITLSFVDIFRTASIIQDRHLEDCKLKGYENIHVDYNPVDWDTIDSDRPFGMYSIELRLSHYIVYCTKEEKMELYNTEVELSP